MDNLLEKTRRLIPRKIFAFFQPTYHRLLSILAAIIYRFPSKEIKVIAVTGTKGKSSTVEIINAILEQAGHKTALSNTIRFKIGDRSEENKFKMSMPGRFFVQKLIRQAVKAGCKYMIMEMTSQGALLNRHRYVELDTLVFTNISPEHIEAHGSYENYLDSKLSVARNMSRSCKEKRLIIANADDRESDKFLSCDADEKVTFSASDFEPYKLSASGIDFTLNGQLVHSPLKGLFNLYNIAAAIGATRAERVTFEDMRKAIENFDRIPGRVEMISVGPKQDFRVVVDYAHTPDSLEKFYGIFSNSRNICVLGGTGGGRDSWKRKEMGRIADQNCSAIILTDEDPYDEDPKKIVDDVASGIENHTPKIIMDRRSAIREAINMARTGDNVLITGKGTDPYIMGPNGSKIPWSDAKIAEEELKKKLGL